MPVPEQVTVNSSVANGLTTVFPYSFKIIEEGDLAVELDGVVQTTGFTISGVGEDTGGDVTFATAPASGVVVNRYLDPPLRRITDYQQHGDYNAETLDADFDRGWTAMQSLSERISRCLQVSIGTTPTPEELLSDLSASVASAAASAVSAEYFASSYVSVKQFGAKGDGVTDDTAAILAAKTSAAGGVLIIPSGVYGISAQIPFNNTITIFADGAVFKWIGSAPGALTNMVKVGDAAATSEANCPRVCLYGLTLDGNNISNVEGFYFTTTRYGHFEKLRSVNMPSAGAFAYTLSGDDAHGLNCADNIFVDLTSEFTYNMMGLRGTNGGFATNNTFYKVYGMFITGEGLVFTNNCDTNFFYGMHLGANVGVSNFKGVVFNNGTSNTTQDNGVTDIVIDGLIVTGDSGTTYGAVLYQCENIIIRGMRLSAASGTLSNFSRQVVSTPQTYSIEVLTGNGPTPIAYRHGKAVSASAGASAGTSPPAPVVASGAYSQAGNITFGTGSGATTGVVLTVTFPSQLDKTPKAVTIAPLNGATWDLKLVPSAVSASGFSLFSVVAPASSQPNTTYSFYYKVEV